MRTAAVSSLLDDRPRGFDLPTHLIPIYISAHLSSILAIIGSLICLCSVPRVCRIWGITALSHAWLAQVSSRLDDYEAR